MDLIDQGIDCSTGKHMGNHGVLPSNTRRELLEETIVFKIEQFLVLGCPSEKYPFCRILQKCALGVQALEINRPTIW